MQTEVLIRIKIFFLIIARLVVKFGNTNSTNNFSPILPALTRTHSSISKGNIVNKINSIAKN